MAKTTKPTPEEVVEQLRAVRAQIEEDVTPMTTAQRAQLRDRTKHERETIVAAISAIGMSDRVSGAIGYTPAQVNDLMELSDRWVAVEGDLRAMLNGITSANLTRRWQLALIADHAFAVTKQLVRWPENEHLVTIYQKMKHMRKMERQKKKRKGAEDAPPEDAETRS
jgi:hypothetical protein